MLCALGTAVEYDSVTSGILASDEYAARQKARADLENFISEYLPPLAVAELPSLLSKVCAALHRPQDIPAGGQRQSVAAIYAAAVNLRNALAEHVPALEQALGHNELHSIENEKDRQVDALRLILWRLRTDLDVLQNMTTCAPFAMAVTRRPAPRNFQFALKECAAFLRRWQGKDVERFATLAFAACGVENDLSR